MTDATAPTEADSPPTPVPDRYASISMPDGELVIYDRDATDGWIQSDSPVPTATRR